jgi:hypothetical protein
VPLMLDGFEFGGPTDLEAALRHYNGLRVPIDYFSEAMVRLRDNFLNVSLDAVLHPLSDSARQAAEDQRAAANTFPAITEENLREAEQPRYLFTVKVAYQDELETIEGTRGEQPYGPPSLTIYDGSSVVAQYPNVERWARQPRSTQHWYKFIENDLETHPRDGALIEVEFENGARAQASFSRGVFSLRFASAQISDGTDAKRWRYLNLP